MLKVDDRAPDFVLADSDGEPFRLSAQRGQKLLLVFYPGDDTPVCTRQLCDYRDGVEAFDGLGVKVVGVSNDSAESHRRFKEKHRLPFTLLTDPRLEVAALYDCKGLLGMKRAVFLIDGQGIIRYQHIEALALFRRSREELLQVIAGLQ
jgi:peroxiredoxin Q/BCP